VDSCEVFVVSNDVDTVVKTRAAEPRIAHLGFMFVDGAIVLPGVQSQLRPPGRGPSQASHSATSSAAGVAVTTVGSWAAHIPAGAAPTAPSVAAAARAGVAMLECADALAPAGMGATPAGDVALAARLAATDVRATSFLGNERPDEGEQDDDCETLHDSQLDGEVLSTCVDDVDDAFADTVMDLPGSLPPSAASVAVVGSPAAASSGSVAKPLHRLHDSPESAAEAPTLNLRTLPSGLQDEFAFADTLVDIDVDMAPELTSAPGENEARIDVDIVQGGVPLARFAAAEVAVPPTMPAAEKAAEPPATKEGAAGIPVLVASQEESQRSSGGGSAASSTPSRPAERARAEEDGVEEEEEVEDEEGEEHDADETSAETVAALGDRDAEALAAAGVSSPHGSTHSASSLEARWTSRKRKAVELDPLAAEKCPTEAEPVMVAGVALAAHGPCSREEEAEAAAAAATARISEAAALAAAAAAAEAATMAATIAAGATAETVEPVL